MCTAHNPHKGVVSLPQPPKKGLSLPQPQYH